MLLISYNLEEEMGKGDKKTARGKRFAQSFGNARPKARTIKSAKTKAAKGKK